MGHDRFCFNVLKYAQIVCGWHDYRWIVTEGGRCRKHHVRYVAGAAGRRWLYGGAHLVQLMVVMLTMRFTMSSALELIVTTGRRSSPPAVRQFDWDGCISLGFDATADDCRQATADESSSASEEREPCGLYADELGVLLSSEGDAIRL
uniref:Uncharacterized protein n=1 Tax=Anopheles melas TaxID=34690 RepID=A0A182U5S4_9DIPT